MKSPRAINGKIAFALIALVLCIAAFAVYETSRFDPLIRKVQDDITYQGALAHAIAQYGAENPEIRIDKFELCKTCRVSVEYGDWSTAWNFTMQVESKAGIKMIIVRARRAMDNTWLVSLKQA